MSSGRIILSATGRSCAVSRARYTVAMPPRPISRSMTHGVGLADDRPVALKMMRPELMSSGAERFLREIRITARLAHPRILPLIDSGVREGAPYLVTPYTHLRAH